MRAEATRPGGRWCMRERDNGEPCEIQQPPEGEYQPVHAPIGAPLIECLDVASLLSLGAFCSEHGWRFGNSNGRCRRVAA